MKLPRPRAWNARRGGFELSLTILSELTDDEVETVIGTLADACRELA